MPKVDPARNYYADLKVAANANEGEIRKAFRALALQYHPDRNPGRETEFVVKFQEIQAAHEILSDQLQRSNPKRLLQPCTSPKPFTQQQRPPPQQHASFSSGADRFTSKNFRTPPTAQRPDTRAREAEARANVFTAWQKMKTPRAEEPRTYNPSAQTSQNNQSNPSQQSNPNGTPFGRSASTRVPSSRKGFDPGTPGGDEGQARSAYRNYTRPAPTPPTSTTPPHPTPPMQNSQTSETPFAEANRMRTPYYPSMKGERTSMFEGIGRSASVRNSPIGSNRQADAGSFSDSGRRQQRNSYAGQPHKPFSYMYVSSSDEDSESEVFQQGNKHRGAPPSKHSQPPPPPPPPTWNQAAPGTPPQATQNTNRTENMSNQFKSRSEENINMKFSPSDWHGKFEGGADYFAPNMQKSHNTRGRTSPTRGRQPQRPAADRNASSNQPMGPPPISPFSQPQAHYQSYPIPPPPPGPPPNLNFPRQADPNSQAAKFKPEEWQDTFKEPSWVFSDRKDTSPRRAPDATKRTKSTRKGSVAQEKRSKAQDQSDSSQTKKFQATAEDAVNGDVDAMDIDPSTPPVPNTAAAKSTSAPPQKEHLNGAGTSSTRSTATTKSQAPGLNGVTTAMVDDSTFSTTSSGGIGLGGLGDALPFASQASSLHPTKSNTAQKLKFPLMPTAPKLPTTYSQAFVDLYFQQFETYCKDYMKATKSMTAHFVARDTELAGDLDSRFAHHRGETSKKLGFTSYMAKMKEDEVVLQTWQVFQENHLKAMAQCEEVRNRTMKLYQDSVA
ncbi:hypothetical protein GQ44DRAFT_768021 [Phaeosphaeriaceae sp. PMI808]|nr:hypothetical protein GQ44DRAFT_768021 [Phaeosphaeriaceae sp. PMI808]